MTEQNPTLKIVLILGSVREGNFTARAARLVADELAQQTGVTVEVIDPAALTLLLPGQAGDGAAGEQLRESVTAADGIIFATPEYHGSYSSVTKLVIENLGFPSVLAGKPIALLGVAAGQIGAIKALEHLRSVLSHVGAIVLPGPVSVPGVQQAFDEDGRCLDPSVERRIRGVGPRLLEYLYDHVCPRVALEQLARQAEA